MRLLIAALLLASLTTLRADPATANAQQVLKDQGFYYGAVTGEKNADTSAAIRRYQIRNGLEVSGELNEETLKSLQRAPAATPVPVATAAPPPVTVPPSAVPDRDNSDLRDGEARSRSFSNMDSSQFSGLPPDREPQRVYPGREVASSDANFADTPYATAPPEVQRKVVVDAQKILARNGLFKYPIDGVFSANLEFSLRAYQARVGLRPTGRLDLETLAALELLPGAHERVYTPRRVFPPGNEPPVRGEWIRP
jgi:peptidoglycan hydrolase-like protein with peptidoglycan-binding domain